VNVDGGHAIEIMVDERVAPNEDSPQQWTEAEDEDDAEKHGKHVMGMHGDQREGIGEVAEVVKEVLHLDLGVIEVSV